jgi:hypothetical protein
METQKAMGRGQLVDRLAAQVGSKNMAVGILKKRGDLKQDGKTLTNKGSKRDAMTAAERAKDRAAKRSGGQPSEFSYDPVTNRAKRIRK